MNKSFAMQISVITILYFAFISQTHSMSSITISTEHLVCESLSKQQKCFRTGLALQCFRGIDDLMKLHHIKLKKIEALILCDWPDPIFDVTIIKLFTNVKRLTIELSNFTSFSHDFPELLHLESINISRTNLQNTRPTLFKKLPSLKSLDLRLNKLDHIDQPFQLDENFEDLYLKDNPWNCTKNLKWLNLYPTEKHHVIDKDDLNCADAKYLGRPVAVVMQFKLTLKEECQQNVDIRNCQCHINYIRPSDDGNAFHPIYAINCSQLNLKQLPASLPHNTSILYVMNNKISDLQPLINNPYYKDVHDIYLDYNEITQLDQLENSEWIENFRIFSLRGNKLTKIPVYAMVDALEKNPHAGKFHLSYNPWKCDCSFTPKFQDLLRKFQNIINDSKNVTCREIEDDKNSRAQVLALKRSDVCKSPTEYTVHPLDILNCVLGSLIVIILSKLGYDYYYYKNYGRLPWIVTKMP